ncbi:MAG: hypothetical protein HQL64_00550 [Magnetococcales bacterium]|nr:hypothetical protein [Magnetococcales bacterium]
MKRLLGLSVALLAFSATSAHAFDYIKFATEKTLKCAHPTVSEAIKTEYVNPAKMEGGVETARVKIFYKGMMKNNSMTVEYRMIEAKEANLTLVRGKVLEDTANTGTKSCPHFEAWEETK